jgi:hypothetical protein
MRAIKNYIKMSLWRMVFGYIGLVVISLVIFLLDAYFESPKEATTLMVNVLTRHNYFLLWLPLVVCWLPFSKKDIDTKTDYGMRQYYYEEFGTWN